MDGCLDDDAPPADGGRGGAESYRDMRWFGGGSSSGARDGCIPVLY